MKRLLSTAAVAATLAVSSAGAALAVPVKFDFAKLATGNEGTWDSRTNTGTAGAGGTFDGATDTWTVGGVGVKAVGSNSGGTAASKAYLDAPSGGKPGGLGVCSSVGAGNQCNPTSDDNIGIGASTNGLLESVTLTFSEQVAITALELRDDDHNPINSGFIGINGTDVNVAGLDSFLASLGGNTVFTFSRLADTRDLGGIAQDFYVTTATVTPVPLPAALPLAMAAFGGLALLGRRRKALA